MCRRIAWGSTPAVQPLLSEPDVHVGAASAASSCRRWSEDQSSRLKPLLQKPDSAQNDMNIPPLTGMLAPVMKPASSAARKATVRAISSGCPRSEEHTSELQSLMRN